MASKFKKSIEDSGAVIVGEYISTPIQPQVSITIINQSSGEVEALIGGRGDTSSSLRSDRATALQRQPGSNFKILYLPAGS